MYVEECRSFGSMRQPYVSEPLELTGPSKIADGKGGYVVKFYETSHPFKSQTWHTRMMYEKHDDFLKAVCPSTSGRRMGRIRLA